MSSVETLSLHSVSVQDIPYRFIALSVTIIQGSHSRIFFSSDDIFLASWWWSWECFQLAPNSRCILAAGDVCSCYKLVRWRNLSQDSWVDRQARDHVSSLGNLVLCSQRVEKKKDRGRAIFVVLDKSVANKVSCIGVWLILRFYPDSLCLPSEWISSLSLGRKNRWVRSGFY